MNQLPSILKEGERARLFPVLAETSKEGRTLSIFLSCLQNVDAFGRSLLASIGEPVGKRSKIECFTEVRFHKSTDRGNLRPDGLITVTTGTRAWSALVEAKVGTAELTVDQLDGYLELAKLNGVNALITLSNQFAPLPSHHPVPGTCAARRRMDLFHWSWMHVVTEAKLLLDNYDVDDIDQRTILQEMNRFLLHSSSGVKGFDQMPAAWTEAVSKIQTGVRLPATSTENKAVVGAWHQAVRHLSYILSRQLSTDVKVRMTRAHATDPTARQKAAMQALSKTSVLDASLIVPNAADDITISADLQKRSVTLSMRLRAPEDSKSTKARLNWLLRQLQKADGKDVHVRLLWLGRAAATQYPLEKLRADPSIAWVERKDSAVSSFEVLLVKDLSARFAQRRNFVVDVEKALPDFYEQVAQHLKAWQAKAPKLPAAKAEPENVDIGALRDELELEPAE